MGGIGENEGDFIDRERRESKAKLYGLVAVLPSWLVRTGLASPSRRSSVRRADESAKGKAGAQLFRILRVWPTMLRRRLLPGIMKLFAMETPHSIFETVLRVRPDDIDMHQHVHNSRYLDYVLAARIDQMERCYGMAMERFFEYGASWYVKTAHINHWRALRLGDSARVRTSISEIRKREVRVVFEILRLTDGRLSAEGYFDYTLVDLGTGRPKRIPDEVIRKYSV